MQIHISNKSLHYFFKLNKQINSANTICLFLLWPLILVYERIYSYHNLTKKQLHKLTFNYQQQ